MSFGEGFSSANLLSGNTNLAVVNSRMRAVYEDLGMCNVIRNQTSLNFFARSLMISRTALHSSGRLKVAQVCVKIAVQSCLMRVLMAVGLIRISSANFRQ